MDTLLAILVIFLISLPFIINGQIERDADQKMKEIFGKDYKRK